MYYIDVKDLLDSLHEEYKIVIDRKGKEFNIDSIIEETAKEKYSSQEYRNNIHKKELVRLEARLKDLEKAEWKSRDSFIPEEDDDPNNLETFLIMFYDKWVVKWSMGGTGYLSTEQLSEYKTECIKDIARIKSQISNKTIEDIKKEIDVNSLEIYYHLKIYTPTRIIFYGPEQECGDYYFEVSIEDLTINNPLNK